MVLLSLLPANFQTQYHCSMLNTKNVKKEELQHISVEPTRIGDSNITPASCGSSLVSVAISDGAGSTS